MRSASRDSYASSRRGEYSGAGLPGRRAAGTRCGSGEWGELVGTAVVLVAYSYQQRFMTGRQATLEYLTTTKIGEKGQVDKSRSQSSFAGTLG